MNVGATALSEDLWFESDDIESMSSATMASRAKGVSAEHLSKIWRISMQEAEATIKGTRQLVKHSDDPTLSRQFTTNDRMLRYPRINEYFFMDMFFASKKKGKGNQD